MTQFLEMIPFSAALDQVAGWLTTSLVWGTALALVTAMVLRYAMPRCRPSLKGALWIVVLVKFVVPVGPAMTWSAASGIDMLRTHLASPTIAKPGDSSVPLSFTLVPMDEPAATTASTPAVSAQTVSNEALIGAVIVLYLLALLFIGGRRFLAYRRFCRGCRALPLAPSGVSRFVQDVCLRVGIRPVREVRLSEAAPAPFILGLFRPVLVLSTRQLDDASELEAVVLHEAAHLRRGDLWVRWLQWLAGTLLFFWPVVAWVNRRLDLIRELACDEWALRHGQLSNGQYARCLLKAVSPAPLRRVPGSPRPWLRICQLLRGELR